jgi:2-amino-4-hydroxy-6-hydroxymethyldihydropteridine diphosphokinase
VALLPGLVAASRVYETSPVGGPPDQGPYLNMVVEVSPSTPPYELLEQARRAEEWAGRQRGERWGPRTLDVDLLMVAGHVVDDPELTLPHPRMWQRAFVLVPLADLAPELVAGHLEAVGSEGVRLAGQL